MIDLSRLWVAEWIVCGFFFYLMVLSLLFPLRARHRLRILTTGMVSVGLAVMLSQLKLSLQLEVVRDWLPAIYLFQGYFLSGFFVPHPMSAMEKRLLDLDQKLFRYARLTSLLTGVTRARQLVLEFFELAHLIVYPMVPLCFGIFLFHGEHYEADNFWTAVLIAGYGCYGLLPWIRLRPPRNIEREQPAHSGLLFRRLNLYVFERGGVVPVNTFPSGYVSQAIAAALGVSMVDSVAGLIFLVLASFIVLAMVLGRYHYAIDSLLCVVVGVIGWWVGFRSAI